MTQDRSRPTKPQYGFRKLVLSALQKQRRRAWMLCHTIFVLLAAPSLMRAAAGAADFNHAWRLP